MRKNTWYAAMAAMMIGSVPASALATPLTQTSAVVTEVKDEAANAIIYLSCTYDGKSLSYDGDATIGADKAAVSVLPGTVDGSAAIAEGDAGLLPYGLRLTLTDATGAVKNITAAIWSEENGQDDLQWLTMRQSGKEWSLAENIADHNSTGQYQIHIYGTVDGAKKLLGGLRLNYKPYRVNAAVQADASYESLFDAQTYYNNYPDLQKAIGSDAAALYAHFAAYGVKEGRVASDSFNVRTYKANYPDLQKAFGSNWKAYFDHYLAYGKAEKRVAVAGQKDDKADGQDISAVFNAAYYLGKYADLRAAFGTDAEKAKQHFLNYGIKEGRQASETFNVLAYQARYADLRKAFGGDLQKYVEHYLTLGIKEGRSGR